VHRHAGVVQTPVSSLRYLHPLRLRHHQDMAVRFPEKLWWQHVHETCRESVPLCLSEWTSGGGWFGRGCLCVAVHQLIRKVLCSTTACLVSPVFSLVTHTREGLPLGVARGGVATHPPHHSLLRTERRCNELLPRTRVSDCQLSFSNTHTSYKSVGVIKLSNAQYSLGLERDP